MNGMYPCDPVQPLHHRRRGTSCCAEGTISPSSSFSKKYWAHSRVPLKILIPGESARIKFTQEHIFFLLSHQLFAPLERWMRCCSPSQAGVQIKCSKVRCFQGSVCSSVDPWRCAELSPPYAVFRVPSAPPRWQGSLPRLHWGDL